MISSTNDGLSFLKFPGSEKIVKAVVPFIKNFFIFLKKTFDRRIGILYNASKY